MTVSEAKIRRLDEERAVLETRHLAYQAYADWISATFPAALAREPGIRCSEWARRNPFRPEKKV